MKFKLSGLTIALVGVFGGAAVLTTSASAQSLERVEVTGSSIKRINTETALPVTIIRRDDIDRSGAQTVSELVEKVSANNGGGYQASLALGDAARPGFSGASLRGLGSQNTLVLLNGRRLAVYAFDGGAVNLSDIPLEAIDRIEILRDGASSLYGTDAVAGVINLITRKDYSGGRISIGLNSPSQPGGASRGANLLAGFGDLASDKFNIMGVIGVGKQDSLAANQRDFAKTAYRPELGVNRLSSNAVPANIFIPGVGLRNPAAPAYGGTCQPPSSFGLSPTDTRCRFDYASVIDIFPEAERKNLFLRGTAVLPGDHQVFAEVAHSEGKATFRISPTPASEATTFNNDPVTLPATSKYYPTAWLTANYPSVVGQDLNLYFRSLNAGPRTNQVKFSQDRVVLGADGRFGNIDYKAGLLRAESKATESYVDGYLYESKFLPAMASGQINPFGPSDAAGNALLATTKILADTRISKSRITAVDLSGSTEVGQLPAGPVGLAFGGDAQRITYNDNPLAVLNSGDVLGGGGSQLPVDAKRDVKAVFAELAVPILRGLDSQFSIRHDKYSDFGKTTNPKVALKWKANDSFLLRGSVGTGFRAPTLAELYLPETQTNTGGVFNDPLYNASVGCAAVFDGKYCDAQLTARQGGNTKLKPETSRSAVVGMLLEPSKDLSFGMDFFQIQQKDLIGITLADTKLDDYIANFNPATKTSTSKYVGDIVTKTDAASGATVIDFIRAGYANLGERITRGVDISAKARLPATEYGRFLLRWEGTYLDSVKEKDSNTGIWGDNVVGKFNTFGGLLRFKQRAEVEWSYSGFETTLAYNWQSGYQDASGTRDVGQFETFDAVMFYKGIKNLKLKAAVYNLMNRKPPTSDQNSYFQVGYDPANTNPIGRVISIGAEYKFY